MAYVVIGILLIALIFVSARLGLRIEEVDDLTYDLGTLRRDLTRQEEYARDWREEAIQERYHRKRAEEELAKAQKDKALLIKAKAVKVNVFQTNRNEVQFMPTGSIRYDDAMGMAVEPLTSVYDVPIQYLTSTADPVIPEYDGYVKALGEVIAGRITRVVAGKATVIPNND